MCLCVCVSTHRLAATLEAAGSILRLISVCVNAAQCLCVTMSEYSYCGDNLYMVGAVGTNWCVVCVCVTRATATLFA